MKPTQEHAQDSTSDSTDTTDSGVPGRTPHDHPESGAVITGWITKLAVSAAIFGVLAFDGISVGVAHFSATDDANNAVQAASESYKSVQNVQLAYNAALTALNPGEALPVGQFSVAADGTTTLTLTKTAKTLVLFRTKATAGWAKITVHVTGKYTGS